ADVVDKHDEQDRAETRHVLLAALSELTRRQRATVVLRYYFDLSEAETAAALGCSEGTVKSQAARGLARLRKSDLAELVHEGTSR
ncbi:MAG TPA: sigma-70 family RNA polymerase sigma factor, partial [Nocardioidaceae bacterium]